MATGCTKVQLPDHCNIDVTLEGVQCMLSTCTQRLKLSCNQMKCRSAGPDMWVWTTAHTCDCAIPTSAQVRTALPQSQVRCQDGRIMHVAAASHVHDMAMLSTPWPAPPPKSFSRMLPCVLYPKSAAPKKPIRAYTTKAIPVTCTPNLQHDALLVVPGLRACVHQVEDASYSVHFKRRHVI